LNEMARFFKKLYTLQKETIDDDFPELEDDKIGDHLGFKVVTTLKDSCFNFKTTGFKHPNGSDVEGTLEPEIKISDYDLTIKGKFQTSNKYEATLSLGDKIVKGTTFFVTGKAEVTDKPKESFELGFDFISKEIGSVNLKFITPRSFDTDELEFYGAGVGYYQGVSVGGDVQLKATNPKDVSKANGYLQFDNSITSSALFVKYDKKKGTKVGVGHHHILHDTFKGAMELSTDPHALDHTTLKLVGNHKFDENTNLRPRLTFSYDTKEVRLGFVLKQKLSSIAKLTLSSDCSTSSLLGQEGKFKHNQFGVTLSFFD